MRRSLTVLVLGALMLGRPLPATAQCPAGELGLAIGAAASNLVYTPAKVMVAVGGLLVGTVTGLLTGGDVRSAYGVWVPAVGGTYFLRPANFDGSEPLEFFGSDYADRPSAGATAVEAGGIYQAQYSR